MAEQADVLEALRRGLIDEEEARKHLQMTHVAKPEERGLGETVMGGIKSAGTGIADAITGFAGLPGELQVLQDKLPPSKTFGKFEPTLRFPTREKIKEKVGEATGMSLYEPQGAPEKYIRSGAEGAASFFNPLNPLGKVAPLFGGAVGLAGEGGEQFMSSQPKMGRLAAEAPVLAAGTYLALKKPQAVRALGEWMGEYGPKRIEEAAAKAKAAKEALGTDVLLPQGADSTALSDIMALAKTMPAGTKIQDILAAQRPAALEKIKEVIGAMSGRGLDQPDANAIVQAAKTAGYTMPREARQRATAPLYEAAKGDKVPLFGDDSVQSITNELLASKAERSLGLTPSGKLIDKTSAKTFDELVVPPSVTELDALSRTHKAAAKASYKEGATEQSVLNRQGREAIADAIDKVTNARSPALAGGKMVNITGKEFVEKPIQEGALGQAFPKAMVEKGTASFPELVGKLDAASAADTRAIASQLSKADPGAFPNLVKGNWTQKVEAAQKTAEGRPSPKTLNDVPMALRGEKGTEQAARFDAQVEEVAKANKLDPVAAREGANALMDAFEVVAREQAKGTAAAEIASNAGTNAFVRFLKGMSLTSPFRGIGWAIEKSNHDAVINKFIEAMTSPKGAELLVDLSQYSMTSHRAKIVARTAAALGVMEQPR